MILSGVWGRRDLTKATTVRVLPLVLLSLVPLAAVLSTSGTLYAQVQAPGAAPDQAQMQAQAEAPGDPAARALPQMPYALRWGIQRPDLVRYNRVEALSLGLRAQIRPQTLLGPVSVTGTARIGLADREPNGRIDLTRETLAQRLTSSLFHELAAIDESARHLGISNSLVAAFVVGTTGTTTGAPGCRSSGLRPSWSHRT